MFETDIRGCYDHIDQQWLMRFMEHRIADRRILKILKQTLRAGVIDDSQWHSSESGIAQGAVISPLLAKSAFTTVWICGRISGVNEKRVGMSI